MSANDIFGNYFYLISMQVPSMKNHHFAWFGQYRKGLLGALQGASAPNKKS
jgi:hypothetical protein